MDSGADVGSRVPSIEEGVTCSEAVIGMFAMSWAYISWLLSRFCSTYGGDASLSYIYIYSNDRRWMHESKHEAHFQIPSGQMVFRMTTIRVTMLVAMR